MVKRPTTFDGCIKRALIALGECINIMFEKQLEHSGEKRAILQKVQFFTKMSIQEHQLSRGQMNRTIHVRNITNFFVPVFGQAEESYTYQSTKGYQRKNVDMKIKLIIVKDKSIHSIGFDTDRYTQIKISLQVEHPLYHQIGIRNHCQCNPWYIQLFETQA